MKTILKTLARGLLIAALAVGATGAGAFKPAYESHGHTMISRSVLATGYEYGSVDGQILAVTPFRFRRPSGPAYDWSVSPDAIDHIVFGVQSRDLGYPGDGYAGCSASDADFIGIPGSATHIYKRFAGSDGYTTEVRLCLTADLDAADGHFDNDNFEGSLNSIRALVQKSTQLALLAMTANATNPVQSQRQRIGSRAMLGKALHTVQDFYAHSNWAEKRGLNDLFPPLHRYVEGGTVFEFYSGTLLASPQPRKDSALAVVGGGTASGNQCVARTSTGFWTGGQTWQTNDGNFDTQISGPLGAISTSAWWDTLFEAGVNWQASASDTGGNVRCDHGVTDLGLGTSKFSGIAKDMPAWPLSSGPRGMVSRNLQPATEDYSSENICANEGCDAVDLPENVFRTDPTPPRWPTGATATQRAAADATREHLVASYQAAKHTKLFLGTVVTYVNTNYTVAEADAILVALFGVDPVPPSIGWVVDRSGTMADVLPLIRSNIASGLRSGQGYVLVDFNGVNQPLGDTAALVVSAGDMAPIAARLPLIEARGGGGCQTPLWSAIEEAVKQLNIGSTLTIFSDASASDAASKAATVTALAQQKNIKFVKIITGSCSPIDPSYQAAVNETNGSLVFVEHSDAGVAAGLAIAGAAVETSRTVHAENAVLASNKTVTFPIETSVSKLTLVITGSSVNAAVIQPSGTSLSAGSGVSISPVLNGQAFVITNPQQGTWQVALTGNGDYTLTAYVNASIDFSSSEHSSVLKVGRAGHEYRPQIASSGQTGRVWTKAHVLGAQAPLVIDLLRLDGSVIASYPLAKMTTDYFEGEVLLPLEPHRLRVRGFASDNTAFARIFGRGNVAAVVAPTGQIAAKIGTTVRWRAGIANAFALNLKNLGGDDTVTISMGTAPTGAALNCTPSAIALPGSSEINLLCSMTLPLALDRADFVINYNTPSRVQAMTVPLNPLVLPSVCGLDVNGDGATTIADALLVTRFLMGYRGDMLVGGIPLGSLRPNAVSVSSFLGSAAQYDIVGRANPSPTALIDGLILTRLMLGLPDSALLNGVTIPAGAQHSTAAAIRTNVNSLCGASF